MVLGTDAAPDAASLAAMLAQQADEEQDDFEGFGFSGTDALAKSAGQDEGRSLALSLFQQYDVDGTCALYRDLNQFVLSFSAIYWTVEAGISEQHVAGKKLLRYHLTFVLRVLMVLRGNDRQRQPRPHGGSAVCGQDRPEAQHGGSRGGCQ